MDQTFKHSISALAFITGLATVGVFSHMPQTGQLKFQDIVDGSLQARYERDFKSSNPLKAIAIASLGSVKYALFRQTSTGAIIGKNGWFFTSEELEIVQNHDENLVQSAIEISVTVDELSNKGIHLLPVIIPDKAEIYTDQLEVRLPDKIANRRINFLNSLSANGIKLFDAAPILKAAKYNNDVFMRDDTHWSPAGSQAVANEIAKRLTNRTVTNAKVTTTRHEVKTYDGDLLAYVPTGILRPLIGPAQNNITRFETHVDTGNDLFGNAPVDIVLVGTSFSAKEDWHFEGFLKQALQADILNFAQQGQGPFAPMKGFLASDHFKNTPPKIVIWEIPMRYMSKDHEK